MIAVRYSLCVVRCSLSAVLVIVGCCCFVVCGRRLSFVVCCLLFALGCSLCVVHCSLVFAPYIYCVYALYGVRCVLPVWCSLYVVRGLFFVGCCLLIPVSC